MLLALALVAFCACTRQPAKPPVERIAILRFENLSPEVSADWKGRAFSEIIATELQGQPDVYSISADRLYSLQARFGRVSASAPGISGERNLALAAGANQVGYGQYFQRNGGLEARLTIESVATGRMAAPVTAWSATGDVLAAASSLARQVSRRTGPYATRNPQALQAYMQGVESPGPRGVELFQQAIAADPDFGRAYRDLAQMKAQQSDLPGALALLDRALARGSALGDAERVRLQLAAATLRNDPAAMQQALATLARTDPGDPVTWRDLAATAVTRHDYRRAVEAYRRASTIDPGESDIWNQLGYAEAYAGDLPAAVTALRRYQSLQPASPNPLDSLGDVNLISGRLREAEGFYLEGAKKDPDFYAGVDFLKAAMAHLMTGDVAGADAIAKQYFDARAAAKDPLLDYRQAQWLWITGRRKAGYQQLETLARATGDGPLREVAAHAYAELAMWDLMLGNRQTAAENARKAVAMAAPSAATAALLARFLAQPPASPAEWTTRANQLAPSSAQAPIRNLALADALLLDKNYQAAAPILQQLYEGPSPGTEEALPVLLAWACLETGRVSDAIPLLRFNPTLPTAGLGGLTPFTFPRIFYLRGVAAQKQGQPEEARAQFRIFQQLSGPDPLMWGEEKKAQ